MNRKGEKGKGKNKSLFSKENPLSSRKHQKPDESTSQGQGLGMTDGENHCPVGYEEGCGDAPFGPYPAASQYGHHRASSPR